jgi:xanthine dehydrogenase small subunit
VGAAEAALTGRPFSEATVEAAAAAVEAELSPISDMRASAAYRRKVAGNLLRKLWLETSEPAGGEGTRPVAEVTP